MHSTNEFILSIHEIQAADIKMAVFTKIDTNRLILIKTRYITSKNRYIPSRRS